MKFIALFTSFVVAALAEPEPFYGWGLGYSGYGLPASRYGGAYGLGSLNRGAYAFNRPSVYATPIIAQAPIAAVAASVPVVTPAVSPYVSTATLQAVPSAPSTLQFHKQDELGNYAYGYDNVNSAKKEVGNAQTGVSGYYTIKDASGSRTINYVADAFGFRATPAHLRKKRSLAYPYARVLNPYSFRGYNNAYSAPLTYSAATPIAYQTPAVATNAVPVSTSVVRTVAAAPSTSQHHRQDEFGNFDYGYQNINSAAYQVGNAQTGVTGGYSYRDAYGLQRTINYVADGLGFRVIPTL